MRLVATIAARFVAIVGLSRDPRSAHD